jgi:hypothetical protein
MDTDTQQAQQAATPAAQQAQHAPKEPDDHMHRLILQTTSELVRGSCLCGGGVARSRGEEGQ